MSDTARELYEKLRRPFAAYELEWRVSRSGTKNNAPWAIVVPYVKRPAVINRLNDVCGIDGWMSETRAVTPAVIPAHEKQDRQKTIQVAPYPVAHLEVGVAIRVGDEWIWRWDGTGMLEPDPPHFSASDSGKGDFSNGFKRAAEQLGVGVYLRELKGPYFAVFNSEGRYQNRIDGQWLRWDPPSIDKAPEWPGELVDRTVPNGNDAKPAQPPADPNVRAAQEKIAAEESAKEVRRLKLEVGEFMTRAGFFPYHLEALILTHPTLKVRFQTVTALKQQGNAEDWTIVWEFTKRNLPRWDTAPRELAEEFPTSEERVKVLQGLLEQKKPPGREAIMAKQAIEIGWSDAVEYWINELEQRENP